MDSIQLERSDFMTLGKTYCETLIHAAKSMNRMKMFSDDDLIEILSINPPASEEDWIRYENELYAAYVMASINFNLNRMQKAAPLIEQETREQMKQRMIERYEKWDAEVSQWKNYIA